MSLHYIDPDDNNNIEHNILHREIEELHHSISPDEICDLDSSTPKNFISMLVLRTDANSLTQYPEWYSDNKYIVVEFFSGKHLTELLNDIATAKATKKSDLFDFTTWDPAKPLREREVPKYAKALLNASTQTSPDRKPQATRQARRSTRRSCRRGLLSTVSKRKKEFLGSRRGDDVLLVYPFAADAKLIEDAAKNLNEAEFHSLSNPPKNHIDVDAACHSSSSAAKIQEVDKSCLGDMTAAKDEQKPLVNKVKQRAHYLTIRADDYDRLDSGEFLNDTLIDFWMQWLVPHLSTAAILSLVLFSRLFFLPTFLNLPQDVA